MKKRHVADKSWKTIPGVLLATLPPSEQYATETYVASSSTVGSQSNGQKSAAVNELGPPLLSLSLLLYSPQPRSLPLFCRDSLPQRPRGRESDPSRDTERERERGRERTNRCLENSWCPCNMDPYKVCLWSWTFHAVSGGFQKNSGGFCSWKQEGFWKGLLLWWVFSVFRFLFLLDSHPIFLPAIWGLQVLGVSRWFWGGFLEFDFLPPILRLVEFCNCFAILVAFCRFDIITMDYLPWFDMQPKFGPI